MAAGLPAWIRRALPGAGIEAAQTGGLPPPAMASGVHRLSYRLQNGRYASSPMPGLTIGTLLHLEAEPTWVRLVQVNDGPEAWHLDAAAIAPTADLGDGVSALNEAGQPDPALWRPVTFGSEGRGGPVPLLPDAGGRRDVWVPGCSAHAGLLGYALSDWMPVKALPRRDGGFGWLLQVRSFSTGALRFAASVGRPDTAIGRLHAGYHMPGDRTDGHAGEATRDDTVFACHGLQFISPSAGATVVGIGDSIIHSSCTTGEVSGFGFRACAMLSTPARPVSYVSEGFPGRNSLGFCANGLWAIETLSPQVAIIMPWTRNEPWTQDMADLSFARATALVEAARRHRCVPILTTAAPVCGDDPATDAIRRRTNERVRSAGRNGLLTFDIDALWGTGSVPNRYRPDFDAGDQWHPNDRACAAAAAVLAPLLNRILRD